MWPLSWIWWISSPHRHGGTDFSRPTGRVLAGTGPRRHWPCGGTRLTLKGKSSTFTVAREAPRPCTRSRGRSSRGCESLPAMSQGSDMSLLQNAMGQSRSLDSSRSSPGPAVKLALTSMSTHICYDTHADSSLPTRAGTRGSSRTQDYLGHANIQHTVRYTKLAPGRFDGLFKD